MAFVGRLPGNRQVALGEVAQATVHEFRAPPAGARREIHPFDERRAQAAGGRVQGNAGAGDTAPDDEDVVAPFRQPVQGPFARGPVEGGPYAVRPGPRHRVPLAGRAVACARGVSGGAGAPVGRR